jgi:hypothetical protein
VQGAKKVQGRSVFRHTLEFELFVATQQLGDLGQPVKEGNLTTEGTKSTEGKGKKNIFYLCSLLRIS